MDWTGEIPESADIDLSGAVDQLRGKRFILQTPYRFLLVSAQLSSLNLDVRGNKGTLRKRLGAVKRHGKPQERLSKHEELRRHVQQRKNTPLEYLLVIDFEATCEAPNVMGSREPRPLLRPEIIEFPIVLVHLKTSRIVARSTHYVKPSENPVLSQFCIELTGITQAQIDSAQCFSQVLGEIDTWLRQTCKNLIQSIDGVDVPIFQNDETKAKIKCSDMQRNSHDFLNPRHRIRNWSIVTDGRSDLEHFLTQQLEISELEYPDWSLGPYIDSRALFASFSKIGRATLANQLRFLGLTFEGREHCGLDDAVNIARVVLEMKKRGRKIETNRYMEKDERGSL